jgi:DNA polymerase (family 10)
MHMPGFGPKRARRIYDELGIDSIDALRAACEQGRLRKLRGFGPKVEESLLRALAEGEDGHPAPRILLSRAMAIGEQIAGALREHPAAHRVEVAGSTRRRVDAVKDFDVVATADDPAGLAQTLGELPIVEDVLSAGDAGARVSTHTGMLVDLKVVAPDQFGNALQHFTGSKAHNVGLREAAVRRGLHVSEYGILDDATGETLRCASEEEVYARLGLAWIPPELREGRGELEAAAGGGAGLPELVRHEDLRGDMHCHTQTSDGRHSLEQMVDAARKRGLEYLAITDHSASHGFGKHVPAAELERQIDRVRDLDASLDGFKLLIGTEANINPDGSIDYPDELLARLDWTVGSVHTAFGLSEREMTARVVAACEHPWVDAIGHPTGRKIEMRPPYAIDMEQVIDAAARTQTMLEINSAPDRRDLNEHFARAAAAAGVMILIDSDAHSTANLELTRYGVYTARRAWLTRDQVANTRPWKEFAPLRKHARAPG